MRGGVEEKGQGEGHGQGQGQGQGHGHGQGQGHGEGQGQGQYSSQVQRVLSRIYTECNAPAPTSTSDNGYDSNNNLVSSPDRNLRHAGVSTSTSPGSSPGSGPLSNVFERVVEYSPRLLRLTFEKKVAVY